MNRTVRLAIEEENPLPKNDGVLFAAIVNRGAINWNFRGVREAERCADAIENKSEVKMRDSHSLRIYVLSLKHAPEPVRVSLDRFSHGRIRQRGRASFSTQEVDLGN